MKKRLLSLLFALLLIGSVCTLPVSALRSYDDTCTGFAEFVRAVAAGRKDVHSEVIVKSIKQPDFRTVHPLYTAKGPDDTYIVRFATPDEAKENLPALRALPGVEYAECNDTVRVQSSSARASQKARSWGIQYMHTDRLADWLHENKPNAATTVAVVDSGINANHEIFAGHTITGTSYVKSAYTNDEYGHGTSVAGIIADVTQGLNVKIIMVKALNEKGEGDLNTVISAIKYAAGTGASVVNISFVSKTCHPTIHDAIRYAMNRGCLPVISSGNYGVNMDNSVCCPAHMTEPVVVAACTNIGMPYFNNCYGSALDLCAPGSNVVVANKNGRYSRASGTSFAAPHVSAIAAMYKMCYPDAGPAKLTELLTQYTKDKGLPGYDITYGYGVPAPDRLPVLGGASGFNLWQWIEYIFFFGWVRGL